MIDFLFEFVFEVVLEGLYALASALVPKSMGDRTARVLGTVFTVITFCVFVALAVGIVLMLTGEYFTAGIITAAVAIAYIAFLVTVKLLRK